MAFLYEFDHNKPLTSHIASFFILIVFELDYLLTPIAILV
jgi:hypothetical protein